MSEVIAKLQYLRGALFAIGGVLAGMLLWVVIWEMGFIASLSTFVMAWLVVWLYRRGAGGVDLKSLYIILPYILAGMALSFFAGFVADALHFFDRRIRRGACYGYMEPINER